MLNSVMSEQMKRLYDLLLGRKTYDIFAGYWPKVKDSEVWGLNSARKFGTINNGVEDTESPEVKS